MPSLSGTILSLAYTFFGIELLTDVIVFGIVCLNLAVISPTPLLHPNLKSILITQSVAVGLYVLDRSVMLVQKFVLTDPFLPANMILQSSMTFISIFKRMIGHTLIIERLLATVSTNSYQNFSKLMFNFVWFSISFIIAFVNMITNEQSWTISEFNLLTSIVSAVVSLLELIIIAMIGYYNQRTYSIQLRKACANNYNIAQRYHVSENVNAAKQLLPTFLCIFVANLSNTTVYIIIWAKLVTQTYQISIVFAAFIWFDTVIRGVIDVTIITHHPMLKRRFIRLLKIVFRFKRNQIDDVPMPPTEMTNNAKNKANDERTEHFKMLQQLWN